MTDVLAPLATVALVVALGTALRRLAPAEPLWIGAERLTYYVLFPALLVHSLSNAEIALGDGWRLAAATLGAILAAGVLTVALRGLWAADGPAFASIFQATTRFNTYIILSLSEGLFGTEGLALASIALAAMIVLSNLLAVGALLHYARGERFAAAPRRLLGSWARNPLILACAGGLAMNGLGLGLPPILDEAVRLLGQPALTFGLLTVGAALTARALTANPRLVLGACAIKLVGQPLAMLGLAAALDLSGIAYPVAFICAGAPVAPSAAIMSRQLGGDVELMAALVTATTCLSAVTLSAVLFLVAG